MFKSLPLQTRTPLASSAAGTLNLGLSPPRSAAPRRAAQLSSIHCSSAQRGDDLRIVMRAREIERRKAVVAAQRRVRVALHPTASHTYRCTVYVASMHFNVIRIRLTA